MTHDRHPTDTWPSYHPDPTTLGDAELLASGALAPMDRFVGPDETASDAAAVALRLPSETATDAVAAGGLVLVDEEGAPIATVPKPIEHKIDGAASHLSGTVTASGRPSSGSFRRLFQTPQQHIATVGKASLPGVLIDRPLLAEEVAGLAEVGEDAAGVVLLVRTVLPQVPAEVLIKSALAASTQIPGARVVAVPLGPRADPADDAALASLVMSNYHVRPVEILDPDTRWREARRALDEDDPSTSSLFDPATLAVLRHWRPVRAERGLTVFFTGLSGSGKSTVARGLIDRLHETDRTVTSVDGDVARRMLSAGLTFSRADRDLNIRRIGWVAAEVTRHGGLAVCAPIAPFAATRADVRDMVQATGDFVLVHISTPLEECERRDRKGLYAKARRGEIPDFTGISSPYEEPEDADLRIDTTNITVDAAVETVLDLLVSRGWLPQVSDSPR